MPNSLHCVQFSPRRRSRCCRTRTPKCKHTSQLGRPLVVSHEVGSRDQSLENGGRGQPARESARVGATDCCLVCICQPSCRTTGYAGRTRNHVIMWITATILARFTLMSGETEAERERVPKRESPHPCSHHSIYLCLPNPVPVQPLTTPEFWKRLILHTNTTHTIHNRDEGG